MVPSAPKDPPSALHQPSLRTPTASEGFLATYGSFGLVKGSFKGSLKGSIRVC